MCRFYVLAFLGFLPIFVAGQQLGFSLNDGRHKIKIPIEVQNNLVIVPVILNNQLPLKFILDTGVRTTILTEKTYSDILQLEYTKKYTIAGPGGEKLIEAFITNNVTIDMPGLHGEGHTMLVLETDYLELRNFLGADIHGVLGYEIFSRFIVEIDYVNKWLTLTHSNQFKPSRRYQAMKMVVEDTKPYVTTEVDMNDSTKVKVKLLVDSGASHGLILEPETDSRIIIPPKQLESIIGRGLGGIITGKVARIKSLKIGKYQIHNLIANFPDVNSYNDTLKIGGYDASRNGAIGGEVLSRFTIIFDFPNEKLYLKKNSDFKKSFYFNLSGLDIKAKGASLRRYEVSEVRKDSPGARADVKVGDQLISINGLPANGLDLNNINGFFNSKPNRKITLEVLRNGVRVKKVFRLESQI
jgi:predicted aspartyl protease